jgi:DNA gyrase subunit A
MDNNNFEEENTLDLDTGSNEIVSPEEALFPVSETVEDRVEVKILESEMQNSFLKYAMSVIASRALPDVRDGLKPVHRRIIYVMDKMGITPSSKYRKSAQIVGEVMGKYHPHGDVAIYDSLVRMAQDFSLRYPLVDGHGNFGSMDGDPAAAMRYTESRMHKPASLLVMDIDKDTVDFVDNYDGSQKEPTVLPTRIPNLIINGVSGIAVGMATSIPPHNINEVTQACIALLYNPEIEIDVLLKYIKGPDLPTGGIIYGKNDLIKAYKTGRGKCVLRATATTTENSIIINEIPYQVNKSTLIEKIANLIKDKKIEGVKDLRDESNKDGVRIVIDCKRDASPEVLLNQLYKFTELQINLHFNLLALVNGGRQPKLLNLKEILVEFINHRNEVVTRRTKFELKKAQSELHILDGLKIALDFIDEVIKLIRSSYDKEEAKNKLIERFNFSNPQVEAILQMRLQTLTNLDKAKIEDRRQALIKLIEELNLILNDVEIRNKLIGDEIQDAANKFNSDRKTKIIENEIGDSNKEDFIEEEDVLVQLTHEMYLKVLPIDTFRTQNRGGRGSSSFNAKDTDYVRASMIANSHDFVYAFTNSGRVFRTRVFELPSGSRTGRGQNLINYFELQEGEKITNLLTITKEQEESKKGYLIFATSDGIVKKTALEQYSNTRKNGIIAIGLRDGSKLIDVQFNNSELDKLVLSSDNGKTVIFDASDISPTGRQSMGVKGMKLKKGDKVIALQVSQFEFAESEIEEGKNDAE